MSDNSNIKEIEKLKKENQLLRKLLGISEEEDFVSGKNPELILTNNSTFSG